MQEKRMTQKYSKQPRRDNDPARRLRARRRSALPYHSAALRFGGTEARGIRCVPDAVGPKSRSASLRRSFAKNRASVVVGGTTEVGRMSASRNSERGKTIVVIGFPARDTKHMPDGSTVDSLGGVLFTAIPLAVLSRRRGHRVVPVSSFGVDCAAEGEDALRAAGCELEHVRVVQAHTQHSFITFTSDNERWERVTGKLPALGEEDLHCVRGADCVVVNFITGAEMEYDTFRWLAEEYQGPIIMDYHTLALGTNPDGRREPRRRTDWAAWFQHGTVVQMNEAEAGALAGHSLEDARACAAFCRDLLSLGPDAVVITRAEKGAVGAERVVRHGREAWATYEVPAPNVPHVVDTVGCGDVFLAGLAVGWIQWHALETAMRFAAGVAALHVEYEGLTGAERLESVWEAFEGP